MAAKPESPAIAPAIAPSIDESKPDPKLPFAALYAHQYGQQTRN